MGHPSEAASAQPTRRPRAEPSAECTHGEGTCLGTTIGQQLCLVHRPQRRIEIASAPGTQRSNKSALHHVSRFLHTVPVFRLFLSLCGASWPLAHQQFQRFSPRRRTFRFRYRKVCRFKSCSSHSLSRCSSVLVRRVGGGLPVGRIAHGLRFTVAQWLLTDSGGQELALRPRAACAQTSWP